MTAPSQTWAGSARSRALAWGLGAVGVLGCVALLLWEFWHDDPAAISNIAGGFLLVVLFVVLGTLLALRQPANPIGWLLTAGGLVLLSTDAAEDIVKYSLQGDSELTTALALTAIFNAWIWPLGLLCSVGLPLLLFPHGRMPARTWRWVLCVMLTSGFLTVVAGAISTEPIDTSFDVGRPLTNPWGVERLSGLTGLLGNLAPAVMLAMMAAAVISLIVRFRAASGVERQQLRWVICGAALTISSILIFPIDAWLGLPGQLVDITFRIGLACLPLSLTVAILRYRLYDLDRIISRTVTYAAVTGLLIATYLGFVATVSSLTPSGSSLAVAASTLAVAALFQPLRRRVQRVVDQRFNRARYDAEQTVDDFRRQLREQVHLDAVRADLLAVAGQTMQPATVNLWLRQVSRSERPPTAGLLTKPRGPQA